MTTETLTFQNIRAVQFAEVEVHSEGGLTFLRGPNESGKSGLLDAVQAFLHKGEGALDPRREGGKKVDGRVTGFGATMTIYASGRTSGQGSRSLLFGVGGLDITDLIEPRRESEEAADRVRAMSLCDLLGLKANTQLFVDLVGSAEAYKAIASPATAAAKSLPDQTEGFKKDVEKHARTQEDEAERLESEAAGLRKSFADIDLTVRADEHVLAAETEDAVRSLAKLEGAAQQADETARRVDSAIETVRRLQQQPARDQAELERELETARQLETKSAEELGKASEALNAAENTRIEALREADEKIAAAQAARKDVERAQNASIDAAKQQRVSATTAKITASDAVRSASERLAGARKHAEDLAEAQRNAEKIGDIQLVRVPESTIEAARQLVTVARQAQERGAIVRRARDQKNQADVKAKHAADVRLYAQQLRDLAASCGTVITKALGPILPEGMFFQGMTLCLREGAEVFKFSELSQGRRSREAVAMTAKSLETQAVEEAKKRQIPIDDLVRILVLRQEYCESLDRPAMEELHALALEKRVNILGAVCSEFALRAGLFVPVPRTLAQSSARGLAKHEAAALEEFYAKVASGEIVIADEAA